MTQPMLHKTLLSTLFGLSALIIGHAAHAASFDCDRAKAADEKAVCANRALNDMDVSMALLYKLDRRFLPMGGRGALIDEQQAWLKTRGKCAADVKCLTDVYQQRIQALQQIIDTRVVTQGPF
jgi:uncharacterized protein